MTKARKNQTRTDTPHLDFFGGLLQWPGRPRVYTDEEIIERAGQRGQDAARRRIEKTGCRVLASGKAATEEDLAIASDHIPVDEIVGVC